MEIDGPESKSLLGLLIVGSRPRTLPAAVVPVVVGAAAVADLSMADWWRIGLALVVSLSLQVAVNYANDYSDGVRGTDENRIGPVRLVGSGLVPAGTVKRAAVAMLAVAGVSGFVLAAVSSWWILVVGLFAMVAAWTYTGGPRPYGYAGFGEIFVFIFFGVVATVGTEYVISETVTLLSVVASIAVGCFACALLVVNNLRDRRGDEVSGKITLAVKMGDHRTRLFFVLLIVLAGIAVCVVGVLSNGWALLGVVGCVAAVPAVNAVRKKAEGAQLIEVLGQVGRAQLVFGLFFSVGLLLAL